MKFIKSLLTFWNRDIINKLTVLVLLALVAGVFAFGFLIFSMPQGDLLQVFGDLLPVLPTPTFDVSSYLTPNATIPVAPTLTESPIPPALTPEIPPSPAPTLEPPTPTAALPTPTPAPTLALASPTQPQPTAQSSTGELGCIPNNPPEAGKVVEVLDGNTVRVLLDDKLIYVIRYIGVTIPTDKLWGKISKQKNSELSGGRKVTLIPDATLKDDRGRLLRYVTVGGAFVNLEIIKQGLGSAKDAPPNSACAQVFAGAEQAARKSGLGMWKLPATP